MVKKSANSGWVQTVWIVVANFTSFASFVFLSLFHYIYIYRLIIIKQIQKHATLFTCSLFLLFFGFALNIFRLAFMCNRLY